MVGADGGTEYVLYPKDRVAVVQGKDRLQDHRLEGEAFTKRVVASCCQSPLYLEYEKGHWFTVYRQRWIGPPPPIQMRIQIQDKPADAVLPQDAPAFRGFPLRFVARLLGSRIGMLLRR